MNEETLGWFHCGRCGQLFRSPLADEGRVCLKCGQYPSTFVETQQPSRTNPPIQAALPEARPRTSSDESVLPQKRSVRKRKGDFLMFKIIGAWLVFVLLLALVAHYFWKEDDRLGMQVRAPLIAPSELGDEDRAILEEAMPLCSQCFGGFLASGTPEERNQFVWKPISVAGKMARFYSMNPLSQVNPSDVKNLERKLLRLESGLSIVSTWEVVDGRRLDAVFHKEDGEWRLDWEQFVRYGEMPWPLFLAGSGGDSGEFRLMARMKMSDVKPMSGQLSIVLYSPRFGYPGDPGNASSEFLVPRDSEDGRLLAAAFNARKAGRSPFDGAVNNADPEEMIRVRVRIKRNEETNGRGFVLEKVLACHWLSISEPGVVPLSSEQVRQEEEALRDSGQPLKPSE